MSSRLPTGVMIMLLAGVQLMVLASGGSQTHGQQPLPAGTDGIADAPPQTVSVPLKHISAQEAFIALQSLLTKDEQDQISMAAIDANNALVIRGSSHMIPSLLKLVEQIDTEKIRFNGLHPTYQALLPGATLVRPPSMLDSKLVTELADLEKQAASAAKQFRSANAGSDEKLKKQLRTRLENTVDQAFDKRQEIQQHELRQLKDRLSTIEKSLSQRAEHKQEIVAKRVKELLNEEQELRWDAGVSGTAIRESPSVYYPPGPVFLANSSLPGRSLSPFTLEEAPAPVLPNLPRDSQLPSLVLPGAAATSPNRPSRGQPTPDDRRNDDSESAPGSAVRRELLDAQQELAQAELELKASEPLLARHAISQSEYEARRLRKEAALNRLTLARREFDTFRQLLKIDVDTARSEAEAAKQELLEATAAANSAGTGSESNLAKLRAGLLHAEGRVERADLLFRLHTEPAAEQPSPPQLPDR